MVKLLNGKNINKVSTLVFRILKLQELFTRIIEVNNPNKTPCIYAMWHAHQFCIHGIPNRDKLHVLVSRSRDGEIIADVVEKWGFKTVRGSKGKKGAVEASMQMISILKSGENCAMMVDGPRGPAKVAKDGVIKIAKLAGVPVVPGSDGLVDNVLDAVKVALKIGYPVIIRPAYTLGGTGGGIAENKEELIEMKEQRILFQLI